MAQDQPRGPGFTASARRVRILKPVSGEDLMMRPLLVPLMALLVFFGGCAQTPAPLDFPKPLPQIDLQRFSGDWHVIANIPYFAERGKLATRVGYRLRDDGKIDDLYFFRRAFDKPEDSWEGIGEVVDTETNARWRVQFVWPFWFDYVIHDVGPDYEWAIVGHPSRDYAWIFARTPQIEPALYADLVARFAALGYDPSLILKVPQRPEDIGQPGFQ